MKIHSVIYLPIEPMECRYSAQMIQWVKQDIKDVFGSEPYTVVPSSGMVQITSGEFLDNAFSVRWKALQVADVAKLFEYQSGLIPEDAEACMLFVVGDTWFPGIEAIRLLCDLHKVKAVFVGWHYAGMADPWDYYTRTLGHDWAFAYERFLLTLFDFVLVGSNFHKKMIVSTHRSDENKIYAVGLSWKPLEVAHAAHSVKPDSRAHNVVFNHRMAEEKNWRGFVDIARRAHAEGYAEWRFILSTNQSRTHVPDLPPNTMVMVNPTKTHYYDLLAKSAIAVSLAKQETFGYAMQEASVLGCRCFAPNQCSYPETLIPEALYDGGEEGLWSALKACFDRKRAAQHDMSAVYDGYSVEAAVRKSHTYANNFKNILKAVRTV